MNKHQIERTRIGILTFPIGEAGCISTSNLVDIFRSLSNDIYLITGNAGYYFFRGDKSIHVYDIKHKSGQTIITRIIRYISTQLKISFKLLKISKNVDIWIFFIGGNILILPLLISKFLKKKVIMIYAGSSFQSMTSSGSSYSMPVNILENINGYLSDNIIVYSQTLIKEWGLEKYKNKIFIAPRHFLNQEEFNIKKKFVDRDNLVGYIGRLSEEKGPLNFVKAIEKMPKEIFNIKYFIGGDGKLRNDIKKYLESESLFNVEMIGWISHQKLPDYLNELKLIVLPSYTEGLPNIMIEAMACGTPVLANPVGSIPDIIKDGETGFIMEDNSPECIAKNIQRVLVCPYLDSIIKNARGLVLEECTYEAAVNRYKKILSEVLV